ncbi:hypothetical protein TNCT_383101 [Trichonephila clavata]|uniref:Uncharacterized protein n=1 Tax=Trichonephila clavata TaxID=2740835 RepID=A0A8X6GM02_TRICU|nr:hypothetical protein TNCT_383101 [Trichonephila clavata]
MTWKVIRKKGEKKFKEKLFELFDVRLLRDDIPVMLVDAVYDNIIRCHIFNETTGKSSVCSQVYRYKVIYPSATKFLISK